MSRPIRILIVEDSEDDLFLLLHELRKGGYEPDYLSVCTAAAMSQALSICSWDAVTSDYNMPGFSALAALKLLQETGLDIPFIVVSGKIGEDQAVAAMKAGAHDYVMKQNLSRLAPALEREIKEAGERRMRREAEIALNRQFVQFRTIFDAMTAIIFVADIDNHEILYMNQYAASVYGGEWQGRTCFSLFLDRQDEPCAVCSNPQLVKDGIPQPAVTTESRNPKNGRWYQCTDRAIEWTDGRLVRLQIAVDITDIKELERVKDEMLSAVSHEMRTPLTAMLGFTEFLRDNEVSPDKQHDILETMHAETERLNELIGNFLDMQRLKSEVGALMTEDLEVADVLHDSVRIFSCNREVQQIVVDCPAGLPKIRGDGEKLHQVMINLISNACKYSRPGSQITISAMSAGSEAIISVQDEGIGIPADLRQKVFERFYRIDNSDRREVGGTGLGLSLVKDIIEAHHGRVWIDPDTSVGCRVMVALPFA